MNILFPCKIKVNGKKILIVNLQFHCVETLLNENKWDENTDSKSIIPLGKTLLNENNGIKISIVNIFLINMLAWISCSRKIVGFNAKFHFFIHTLCKTSMMKSFCKKSKWKKGSIIDV